MAVSLSNVRCLLLCLGSLFSASVLCIADSGEDDKSTQSVDSDMRGIFKQRILERQMTVAFSVNGRFAVGKPWNLSINSAGQAELTITTRPDESRVQLQIDKDKLAELRKAMLEESLFTLENEYGHETPSGHRIAMTIVVGDLAKTINFRNMNLPPPDADRNKIRESARALRIAKVILSMVNDERAVNLRAYFESVIKSAEK